MAAAAAGRRDTATREEACNVKLNAWQWLGVVLLVIGIFLYVRRETAEKQQKEQDQQRQQQAAPQPTTPASTQPSAGAAAAATWLPATQPAATQPAK